MERPLVLRVTGSMMLVFALLTAPVPGLAGDEGVSTQDEGQWVEGGSSFEEAVLLDPLGLYHSRLPAGGDHYYRFHVDAGNPINIEIRPFCNTGSDCPVLSSGSLPAPDNSRRNGFRILSPQGVLLDTANTNQGDSRVMVSAAPGPGEYRFHVTGSFPSSFRGDYSFCFLQPPGEPHPCPDIRLDEQEIIWGGAMPNAQHTRVLLMPPAHGDLGNPLGPTTLDYLDAAIEGIREWERVLSEFAADYPQFDYLDQIEVEIAVFDGTQVQTNYDIVISYVPTGGTQFRGAATTCMNPPRCIVLSLYSMSPRSGQTLPDYPEVNDMEAVTKHEFAHVWGLGHTLTWTEAFGPDLMNSPATFVYGDGSPVGDGGHRSPEQCISTLNLYGMGLIFGFLDEGHDEPPEGWGESLPVDYRLPDAIPYTWYC